MDLMQGGFPSRTQFKDLYDMYKDALPPALAKLDPRTFAKALFKALGLNEEDFQFGVSRVFFRPGKFAEFDQIMKADPENLVLLVAKVMKWLIKAKWKKMAWACVSALKFASKIRARGSSAATMQRMIKMYFARKQHLPRAKGLNALTKMRTEVASLEESVNKLPKNKEKYLASVNECLDMLNTSIQKVREDTDVDEKQIKEMEDKISATVDKQLDALKKEQQKQKLLDEQKKLEEQKKRLEEEKARKEAETQGKVEELKQMEERKEMAHNARKEDELAEKEAEKAAILAEKNEEKEKKAGGQAARQAKLEEDALDQERRDQELAMRLAMDHASANDTTGAGALSDDARAQMASGQAKRSNQKNNVDYQFANKKQEQIHRKHDLSKWKYADLRDTINTSTVRPSLPFAHLPFAPPLRPLRPPLPLCPLARCSAHHLLPLCPLSIRMAGKLIPFP